MRPEISKHTGKFQNPVSHLPYTYNEKNYLLALNEKHYIYTVFLFPWYSKPPLPHHSLHYQVAHLRKKHLQILVVPTARKIVRPAVLNIASFAFYAPKLFSLILSSPPPLLIFSHSLTFALLSLLF